MLYLREYDPEPFREALLDACLTLDVYDTQFNGAFGRYIADLVTATHQIPRYVAQMIGALNRIGSDANRWRIMETLTWLAKDGDAEVEAVVRQVLAASGDIDDFTDGSDALIELDGLAGAVTIARRIAELAPQGADLSDWEPSLADADHRFGESAVEAALEEAAAGSDEVRNFLTALQRSRAERTLAGESRVGERPTFEGLRAVLAGTAPREMLAIPFWWRWGENAPDDQIRWVVEQITEWSGPADVRLRALLSVFRQRTFPGDYRVLMPFIDSGQRLISIAAFNAIERMRHPDLREFGLSLINDPDPHRRGRAVALMLANFAEGDQSVMLRMLEAEEDEDVFHHWGIDIRTWLDDNPVARRDELLSVLCERGPCALCRKGAVRMLIDHGAFTDTMARECLWDADLDTRKLAEEYLAARA